MIIIKMAKQKNLRQKIVQARNLAKRELAKARTKLMVAEKKVTAYAQKNPKKAMLIAAGVGAAVGAGVTLALSRMKKK